MSKHYNKKRITSSPYGFVSTKPTLNVSGVDLNRDQKVYPRGFPGLFRNLMRYYDTHGKLPQVHDPLTFNDKIWFRLLYDRRQILTDLADKYAVRDYVNTNIDSTILPKLYFSTENPENIPFNSLPKSFIAKANHGSGWTYIVSDKDTVDTQQMKTYFKSWLQQNYYDRKGEWAYKNIKSKIIFEELLTYNNRIPNDYKFYCFDGKVAAIQIDIDRFERHQKQFVTPDWRVITSYGINCQKDTPFPKPQNLIDMIEVAQKLSQSFDFLRVDLYNLNGRLYFGEITIYPYAGVGKFIHGKLDIYLGGFWKINQDNSPIIS